MLPIYSRIRFITDEYMNDGIRIGDIGFIIEIYPPNHYEIDVVEQDGPGYSKAVLAVKASAVVADDSWLDQQRLGKQ